MNRYDEYKSLIQELDDTPPALEYTVTRAKARNRKAKIIRRSFAIPMGSVAAFFISFVILVNASTSFALACGRIPFLKELAAAVAFSPSLSAIVENEFVQLIELEQSKNDVTMKVEYVIVDQKQVNLFYTLHSVVYSKMDVEPTITSIDGKSLEGYSIIAWGGAENGKLRHILIDFVDNDVPEGLVLTCSVSDKGTDEASAPQQVPDDILFRPVEEQKPDMIATFEFTLNFDPYFTHQGEIITLNQRFVLDGQQLTVSTVEIYPTHARLNLKDDPSNTAWLNSLDFYFENEKGDRFEAVGNGITATGSPDSPMMQSHRLESAFFARSKNLTLYIEGAVWLDKDMERVRVDLVNVTAETLPEGVVFENAARKFGGWELVFSGVERKDNYMYQLFGSDCYDEDGNEYTYNSVSFRATDPYVERQGAFFVQFALADYPYGTVYLSPEFSRATVLEQPVILSLK